MLGPSQRRVPCASTQSCTALDPVPPRVPSQQNKIALLTQTYDARKLKCQRAFGCTPPLPLHHLLLLRLLLCVAMAAPSLARGPKACCPQPRPSHPPPPSYTTSCAPTPEAGNPDPYCIAGGQFTCIGSRRDAGGGASPLNLEHYNGAHPTPTRIKVSAHTSPSPDERIRHHAGR